MQIESTVLLDDQRRRYSKRMPIKCHFCIKENLIIGTLELHSAYTNELDIPWSGIVRVFKRLQRLELPVGYYFIFLFDFLDWLCSVEDNRKTLLRDFDNNAHFSILIDSPFSTVYLHSCRVRFPL